MSLEEMKATLAHHLVSDMDTASQHSSYCATAGHMQTLTKGMRQLLHNPDPAWPTEEYRPNPTSLVYSGSPLSSQKSGIWRSLWLSSPLFKPDTVSTKFNICFNYWWKPFARYPKHIGQEVPKLMASILAPSSASSVSASTMQDKGVPTLWAPLVSGSLCSFLFHLAREGGRN